MDNKILNIDKKTNEKQLIHFLETAISDEIILSTFVRTLKIVEVNNDCLIIGIDGEFGTKLINKNYFNQFLRAAQEIFNNFKLEIKIINFNSGNNKEQIKEIKKPKKTNNIININPKFTFDNYVISDFNEKPVNASLEIIKKPGVFSPLFIYSSSGLGKTHLLHAIGNKIKNKSIIYINADSFTSEVVNAIKESNQKIDDLIKYYKSFDYLTFDDIQNLSDRTTTSKVLFNIINEFLENPDKQLIFAADKTPNELGGFQERFITRFEKGLTLEIKKPKLNDLILILKRKIQDGNLNLKNWEEEALDFIARNYSTSIRSIEGAITRIKFFSLNKKEIKYNYTTVNNIFQQLPINKEELTPERIINVIVRYYKISKSDIYGKTRKKNVVLARYMAMWFVRSITKISYQKIGGIFGNRDHSTVLHGIDKIELSMKMNTTVKTAVKNIEKMIKKVS